MDLVAAKRYDVGGHIYDVPVDQDASFLQDAAAQGLAPSEVVTYAAGDHLYHVPTGQVDSFIADAKARGLDSSVFGRNGYIYPFENQSIWLIYRSSRKPIHFRR